MFVYKISLYVKKSFEILF